MKTQTSEIDVSDKKDVILCPHYTKLLNAMMPPTLESVKKHKYAFPASVHIDPDGRLVEAKFDVEEYTANPATYIQTLGDIYRKLHSEGKLKACGIVYIGVIKLSRTKQQDAIILKMDSVDSYPIIFIQKYKVRSGSRGKVVFDEIECELSEPILVREEQCLSETEN